MALDLTKKLKTRSGDAVRVLCTDAKGEYPLVVLIDNGDGREHPEAFTADGKLFSHRTSPDDLVNA